MSLIADPQAAVTLTYIFRPQCSSLYTGRNVGRRMVVAQSNCSRMGVERRSKRNVFEMLQKKFC